MGEAIFTILGFVLAFALIAYLGDPYCWPWRRRRELETRGRRRP